MDISDLISDFLESLEIEKGRSTKTTENYGLYLARFLDLITQDFPEGATIKPADLTPEILRKFRLRLNRFDDNQNHERLSALTQSYHLIALRGFLKYLAKRGIKSLDPSLVDLPRAAKKQVTFLHFDEVSRLLSEIPTDTETGLRDRAIIELLFSGGLRVSELCNLNRDSINLARREFMVRGKGKKDRPIFIDQTTAEHIEEYLNARTDTLPALFLNNSSNQNIPDTSGDFRRLSPRSIERIIGKYTRLAGITKHVTPHTLRHSFATAMLAHGANLESIQQLLGHERVDTTAIYTHITDPHLKEVHEKFHTETKE